MEPGEPDIMKQPPRSPKESIFAHGLSAAITIRGILIAVSTLASFLIVFSNSKSIATARTCALVTLVVSQLIHVFECKSERKGLFEINIFSNMYLLLAVISSVLMLCAVIYVPFLMPVFATVPLKLHEWLIAGGISLLVPILFSILRSRRGATGDGSVS
jgi:Ca2+-transporting ATPase